MRHENIGTRYQFDTSSIKVNLSLLSTSSRIFFCYCTEWLINDANITDIYSSTSTWKYIYAWDTLCQARKFVLILFNFRRVYQRRPRILHCIFLSGSHFLQSSITLNNIPNITLKGIDHNNVTIASTIQYTIVSRNVSHLSIEGLTFDLTNNQWLGIDISDRWITTDPSEYHDDLSAALKISDSREVIIADCTFKGSGNFNRTRARALYSDHSNITIVRSVFKGSTGGRGGAIYASANNYMLLSGNIFNDNIAYKFGGAIYLNVDSIAILTAHNRFSHNLARYGGGAINCDQCTITIKGNSSFENNQVTELDKYSTGGAIRIDIGHFTTSGTVLFSDNEAVEGGAIYLEESTAQIGGQTVMFLHNSAENGGGMSLRRTSVKTTAALIGFVGNFAKGSGGGLRIGPDFVSDINVKISATFTHNKGGCGGAISVYKEYRVTFVNTSIIENSGSAVCIFDGNVTFTGTTQIIRNSALSGGGIKSRDSFLTFAGVTIIKANSAPTGGAISCTQGGVTFRDSVQFVHNRADSEGGAIYALGSNIVFKDKGVFDSNSAMNGGVMYFGSSAILTMSFSTKLYAINNSAAENGGVIYLKDTPTLIQCYFKFTLGSRDQFLHLPYCFLQTHLLQTQFILKKILQGGYMETFCSGAC